jgi:hypothetical protein
MSAFRRRIAFAAPLIITVSCSKGEPPAKELPPPRNPPEPQPVPKPLYTRTWHVMKNADGCLATQEMNCPPSVPCNPPAPQQVVCPADAEKSAVQIGERDDKSCVVVATGAKADCPLPYGQKLPVRFDQTFHVSKTGKTCEATDDEYCGPKKDCPPPPRFSVVCPPGQTDENYVRVGVLPDSTCMVIPEDCADTSCAGVKTECPSVTYHRKR